MYFILNRHRRMKYILFSLLISFFRKHLSLANIVLSPSFPIDTNYNNQNIKTEYLKKPILEWTASLCNGKIYGCGLNTGNGIVSSLDNRFLYATTDDGALSIIKAKNGKIVKKHIPESDDNTYYTICQSSVSIFYKRKVNDDNDYDNNNWDVGYLVYSVVDIPNDDNLEEESRIIALDSKGRKLWSSKIKGVSNGTPVIGTNGKYIYVNHNTHNETKGHISVLDATDNGKIIHTSRNTLPYGPLSIQSDNNIDTLFWGESIGKGYSNKKDEVSKVRQMKVNHNYNNKFDVEVIHTLASWSTNSEISISRNSGKLRMVGTESRVYAMEYNGTQYKRMWRRKLDLSLRNSSARKFYLFLLFNV